ncbi:hypothetical protein MKEN_00983000 [Mycena kentingensis (nom. inval.)]|nr:hypothetical protein MKEN_00983000 [Mycena kentingensis (nom. inval.)]
MLPRWALYSVSTTSWTLYAVAAPRIYADLQFRPGMFNDSVAGGTHSEKELERLAVWSSERIAPLVRTCSVVLYGSKDVSLRLEKRTLTDATFEAISRFVNVQTLLCHFSGRVVELYGLRLDNLKRLETLRILGGQLKPAVRLPDYRLRVQHFVFNDNHPVWRLPGRPAAVDDAIPSRLSLLDPRTLRTLELSSSTPEAFFSAEDTGTFASLRTLRLTFLGGAALSHVRACLAPFPALRELSVHLDNGAFASMANDLRPGDKPAPLPCLDRYTGPAAVRPLFSALKASPAEVIITSLPYPARLAFVLTAFRVEGARPDMITTLHLCEVFRSAELMGYSGPGAPETGRATVLEDIVAACPRLANLTLEFFTDEGSTLPEGPADPDNTLTHQLRALVNDRLHRLLSSCAPALQTATIRWNVWPSDKVLVPFLPDFVRGLSASTPSRSTWNAPSWSPIVRFQRRLGRQFVNWEGSKAPV